MVLILMLFLGLAPAQEATSSAVIRSISLFRNEIQLDIKKNKDVKVGSKFAAQTAVKHKCLLVVTKIIRDLAYADANHCPGYATLKKGQLVSAAPDSEVNEEMKITTAQGNT